VRLWAVLIILGHARKSKAEGQRVSFAREKRWLILAPGMMGCGGDINYWI
jgi:hypothetical protein